VLLAVLWLMERWAMWWLYVWLFWCAFNLLLLFAYPTWIAPLFNKFVPLDDKPLKARVEALLARCGFSQFGPLRHGRFQAIEPRQRLFHRLRQDASASSSSTRCLVACSRLRSKPCWRTNWVTSNTGMSLKRIVHALRHVARLSRRPRPTDRCRWFFRGSRASTAQNTALGLTALLSRRTRFHFSADPVAQPHLASRRVRRRPLRGRHASANDLVAALVKLYEDNAATLTPDPLHSLFYDSHPPAALRIARLQEA
jgi:STE24 endopeptidase